MWQRREIGIGAGGYDEDNDRRDNDASPPVFKPVSGFPDEDRRTRYYFNIGLGI